MVCVGLSVCMCACISTEVLPLMQFISGVLEHSVLRIQEIYGLYGP